MIQVILIDGREFYFGHGGEHLMTLTTRDDGLCLLTTPVAVEQIDRRAAELFRAAYAKAYNVTAFAG